MKRVDGHAVGSVAGQEESVGSEDCQSRSMNADIGLPDDFLRDRRKVNERRALIIGSILRRRDFDLSSADVLEVGSHLGLGLLAVDTNGLRVGVEYFDANCRAAKVLATQSGEDSVSYIQGTAVTLPFKNNRFDLVFSHHVIEHMLPSLWPKYISEMSRVLKRGGYTILSFPQWHFPVELHYRLPFLHWLPKSFRSDYLRLIPAGWWNHWTKVNSDNQTTLVFTEIPKTNRVLELAKQVFAQVENVTREFAGHALMNEHLGQKKQKVAFLLAETRLCPEHKLLLRKRSHPS